MTICKTLFMTLSMTMAIHVAVANTITKYEAENATPYKCEKCMSDSRVITLDDMPGWKTSTAVITPQSTAAPADRTYSIDGMILPATHSAHSNIQIINSRKIITQN